MGTDVPACAHCETKTCPLELSIVKIDLLPNGTSGKEPVCQYRRWGFDPWVGKIPLEKEIASTLIFLPGQSHGQKSLAATVHGVSKSRK